MLIDEALAKSSTQVQRNYEVGRISTAIDLVRHGICVAPLPATALTAKKGEVAH